MFAEVIKISSPGQNHSNFLELFTPLREKFILPLANQVQALQRNANLWKNRGYCAISPSLSFYCYHFTHVAVALSSNQ